ncbi:TonB-dependent receptor [Phenylobacterium soli]|uniref:TonB-dependent receptor n=1 Tax=Phenylobacterium soli TaxID=2170551 RepID=A0A328ANW4_9CAUL|nr:TonB-dependent receptor [Phenylobacterium soli]
MTATRERLLASSMICGVALLGVSATQAAAQTASGGSQVSEIVVTGSRIPQPNLTSASPVTVVGAQDIKLQGVTRTEDLINSLPQVVAAQGAGVSNGSQGIATVDLRGLGPARTLVLIDGRRVVPGDPRNPVTDLNFIPSPLVERVDVLTGGASAVYGSDAVSGVVNFIMMKNFEGVRLDAEVGEYQHNNDDSFIQGVNKTRGYTAPNGSVWDGRQTTFTAVMGINSSDGKGNATVYAGYRSVKAILQAARDYSFCSLQERAPPTNIRCGGSGTTPAAHFFSNDLANASLPYEFTVDTAGPGNTVKAGSDLFNFAPFNYYQRPDEQYTAGAFAHYEFSSKLDAYAQIMFMDDHTRAQIAPSGIFGQTFNISCSSPLLSAQEVQTFCTNAGLTAADSASLAILKRNTEGGNRIDDLRHTDYRIVVGAKGDLSDNWSYDAYGQFGRAILNEHYLNDFSLRRLTNALNVTTDASGAMICADASARAEGCVPYNIFKVGGVTPAALGYVSTPGFQEGATEETVVNASVTGKIPALKSPYATDPIGVAGGVEYRREALDLSVDAEFQSGDLTGQGGPTPPVGGSFDVYELFGEARIPLAQDMPFAKDLSLDMTYRYSDYSSSAGTTNTYGISADWKPIDDLRFRASYQRAVRAPNVVELFTPAAVGLGLSNDPCAGSAPKATQAQCLRTGLTAAQYGHIPSNPAQQYNSLAGGNTNLKPEEADTYSVGVVLTPTFLPGFTFSVDYFDIKVNDYINGRDPNLVLTSCLQTGDPTNCALVHRAPGTGSLWLGQAGYVEGINTNLGYLQTKGVDVEATYRTDLGRFGLDNWGGVNVNFNGTYLDERVTNPLIKITDASGKVYSSYDCAGLYGATTCAQPRPQWRHRMRVTWNTPVDGLQISGAWRYIGSVKAKQTSSNPFLSGTVYSFDQKLAAQSYFDLAGTWHMKDHYTFRVGVNNVFDKQPPLVGSVIGGNSIYFNGNTYPTVYDALGRFAFASITAEF